ncbi:hypothetical protein BJ085DRAFT_20426, partial [Dimargaris cristalligena]
MHALPALTAADIHWLQWQRWKQQEPDPKEEYHSLDCAICQDHLVDNDDSSTTADPPSPHNRGAGLGSENSSKTAAPIARQMPCQHIFHEECLFPWLEVSNTCPTCRYELLTDNPEYNESVKRRMAERD